MDFLLDIVSYLASWTLVSFIPRLEEAVIVPGIAVC